MAGDDQPGDGLGLALGEAEPRAQGARDLGAEHAMIAAAALGDVVQQHGDIEDAARRDPLEQAGGERMIVLELPCSICASRPIARIECSSTV